MPQGMKHEVSREFQRCTDAALLLSQQGCLQRLAVGAMEYKARTTGLPSPENRDHTGTQRNVAGFTAFRFARQNREVAVLRALCRVQPYLRPIETQRLTEPQARVQQQRGNIGKRAWKRRQIRRLAIMW